MSKLNNNFIRNIYDYGNYMFSHSHKTHHRVTIIIIYYETRTVVHINTYVTVNIRYLIENKQSTLG